VQLASILDIGPRYRHIYVSPHFDDMALSLGGTALRHARRAEPGLVVSVCTAAPGQSLTDFAAGQHAAWGGGDAWRERETEERAAMAALGVDYLWLGYPDAIYRGDQYLSDDDLFGVLKSGDHEPRARLADDLVAIWRRSPAATVYLPLAVGNHVDHQLCLAAAPALVEAGAPVALYEDSPYALVPGAVDARLAAWPTGLAGQLAAADLSPTLVEFGELVVDKVSLVARYASQVPWIFRSIGSAEAAIREHDARLSGSPEGFAERIWLLGKRGAS
jgi:LmbE family N-acetylglucosaminyl deacetylase